MYFYVQKNKCLEETDEDSFYYNSIDGALMFRGDVNVGDIFYVYVADNYNGVVADGNNMNDKFSIAHKVSGRYILRNKAKLKPYCNITITGNKESVLLTSVFDTDTNGNKWECKMYEYNINSEDPRLLIECAMTEMDCIYNMYNSTINITESIEGALLILIPKLIKLILIIISKIAYLLAIPLINALIHNTKNIRRTGEAVITGNTTIGEVVSSINYADVRAAAVSASKGDAAEFVVNLDKSLSDVKTSESKRMREVINDDGHIYDNLATHNKNMIENINTQLRKDLKIVKFIDEKKLNTLTNSLEMLKDENLIHTDMYYIDGIDTVTLSEFESKNHRYDLVFLNNYIDHVDVLVSYLEKVNSPELVAEVREDTHDNRKIFSSYYLNCVAKMNSIREYLPQELYSNHFRLNADGKVVSNLKLNGDKGDFEHLKDTGKIKKKTVLEILKECKDDLDDLNATTVRSFGFYAGHINNKNNTTEINARRDNINSKLDSMQQRVNKLNPEAIGYGVEHSYVAALLDFLRTDLSNILNTIKTSKIYFMDNHEAMMDVVDILSEEIVGTYMYIILEDIVRNPNVYKATDTAMKTIIAMYKDRGGKV